MKITTIHTYLQFIKFYNIQISRINNHSIFVFRSFLIHRQPFKVYPNICGQLKQDAPL